MFSLKPACVLTFISVCFLLGAKSYAQPAVNGQVNSMEDKLAGLYQWRMQARMHGTDLRDTVLSEFALLKYETSATTSFWPSLAHLFQTSGVTTADYRWIQNSSNNYSISPIKANPRDFVDNQGMKIAPNPFWLDFSLQFLYVFGNGGIF